MAKRFYKNCGCGGYPPCTRCGGSGHVRDFELEKEYAEYQSECARDERLERESLRDCYPLGGH